MARRFEGKSVVVTGASRGIGESVARQFADEGASIALVARSKTALDRISVEISGRGARAVPIPGDVSDLTAIEQIVAQAAEALGGIDILVNNAGLNHRGPIEQHDVEDLVQIVRVNLIAPIAFTRLALPHLRKRRGGRVVNVASIAGRIPLGHEAVYSATKFALRAFTFALEEELRGSGITVSAVSPGPVETEFILDGIDDVPDLVFAQPMSSADDVARLVLDCAADGAAERVIPKITGVLATAGYLFPGIQKLLVPMMQREGARAKAKYRKKHER